MKRRKGEIFKEGNNFFFFLILLHNYCRSILLVSFIGIYKVGIRCSEFVAVLRCSLQTFFRVDGVDHLIRPFNQTFLVRTILLLFRMHHSTFEVVIAAPAFLPLPPSGVDLFCPPAGLFSPLLCNSAHWHQRELRNNVSQTRKKKRRCRFRTYDPWHRFDIVR